MKRTKAAFSVDSKTMEAVAASINAEVDVTTWLVPESRGELAELVEEAGSKVKRSRRSSSPSRWSSQR